MITHSSVVFLICWKRNSHLPISKSILIIKKSNLKKACEYTKNADFVQVFRIIYQYYFSDFILCEGKFVARGVSKEAWK